LDDNDEISTPNDLYNVVGSMLEGLDGEMDSKTVQQICSLLYDTRNSYVFYCFSFEKANFVNVAWAISLN